MMLLWGFVITPSVPGSATATTDAGVISAFNYSQRNAKLGGEGVEMCRMECVVLLHQMQTTQQRPNNER